MGKIYVFGIGGTGSRVLRALTMLLASGVECAADQVIPIIVDPDAANNDVTRTVEALKRYVSIREKLSQNTNSKCSFFKTDVQPITRDFKLPLVGIQNMKFGDYIGVKTMSMADRAMMKMLFSDKNLETDMQVGFKGNPNIGSVVLNQFAQSTDFVNFANAFTPIDKIFIVSSIFGGTGASGFPLLLKTLRSNNTLPNHVLINNAPIGALSVLPYFDVAQDGNSSIDSDTFIAKTRAALAYYKDGITGNNSIDTIYYIGDNVKQVYDNHEGGIDQSNNAHFIEFASAMAILDFAKDGVHNSMTSSVTKEFGIRTDANGNELTFNDLEDDTVSLIRKPLSQFTFFVRYLNEAFNESYTVPVWAKNNRFDKTFRADTYYRNVREFATYFQNWMSEMKNNKVSFAPVSFANDWNTTLCGLKENKPFWGSSISSYVLDDFANDIHAENLNTQPEHKFLELFSRGTDAMITKRYKF